MENVRDEGLLTEARARDLPRRATIRRRSSTRRRWRHDSIGGAAVRLEAHASDLNPVAVLINKALIEILPKFRDRPPVHPSLQSKLVEARGAEGLAADVRAYGQWMRDEAERRIGHLYPKADLPDGSKATVLAWIWARTVSCPNPACGIEMPLVRSWWLGKKKGKEAFVVPRVVGDPTHPSGLKVKFEIGHDPAKAPTPATDGTMSGRTGAVRGLRLGQSQSRSPGCDGWRPAKRSCPLSLRATVSGSIALLLTIVAAAQVVVLTIPSPELADNLRNSARLYGLTRRRPVHESAVGRADDLQ